MWNSAPASLAIAASAGMSCTTPVSLFTAITLTSSVGAASASRSVSGSSSPSRRTGRKTGSKPSSARSATDLQDAFVLGRHGDDAPALVAHARRRSGRRP